MKNKGFSLIELLAVIIILGLLIGLTVSIINGNIAKSKEIALELQKKEIISASRKYVTDNTFLLPDDSKPETIIKINDLISNNYLENDNIIDPVTNEKLKGCVLIKYKTNNEEYNYSYTDTCSE